MLLIQTAVSWVDEPLVGWPLWLSALLGLFATIGYFGGLWKASGAHKLFQTAFWLRALTVLWTIMIRVLLWMEMLGTGSGSLLDISITSFLELWTLFCICTATSDLLTEVGDPTLAVRGRWLWKLRFGCTILYLGSTFLTFVAGILAAATQTRSPADLALTTSVVAVLTAGLNALLFLFYIGFLYLASRSLMR